MRWSIVTPFALLTAHLAESSPIQDHSSYAVKETHFVPRGWTHVGIPDSKTMVDLRIGLKNKKFSEVKRHLYEVSDPYHRRYGQHLSQSEIENLIKPDVDASSLVDNWLEENKIGLEERRYSPARDWISLSLPVWQVEQLLDTRYSTYRHEDGETLVRTTTWSLPLNLHEHISTIQPTTAFLRASPKLQTVMSTETDADVESLMRLAQDFPPNITDLGLNCNFEAMTPQCLQVIYGLTEYTPQSSQSHIGFTNYLDEVPNRNDTSIFLRNFRPDAVASAYSFEQISIADGLVDNGSTPAGLEANLDVQTIAGLVWPINITSYSTGGSPPFDPDLNTPNNTNEPYLVWLDYILKQSDLPQVISTSYGDDEQTVPQSYAEAVCEGLAQLGLRGVSLLFSSGDYGVGANGTCQSNDGKNSTRFLPAFPASCPFITAVGGTRAYPEVVAFDPRNGYASGSGFSNYFEQPKYQRESGVVDAYVKGLNGKWDGLYNKSGRAYPDLAAQGYKYLTIHNGTVTPLDGTSCSSPTIASIISLLNDARLAAGQKPMGFLNPWLYSVAGKEAFTDVVNGSSIGCDDLGFAAAKGWDVASGWGTPQFPKMLELLKLSS